MIWVELSLGMVTAWIVCSAWFWKFMWRRMKAIGRLIVGQSVQETWHDRGNIKYVGAIRTVATRQPVESSPMKSQEAVAPKSQNKQGLPEDLSTLSKEQITELLKTSEVRVKQ